MPSSRYCGCGVPLLGHTVRVLHASVNFRSLCLGFFTRMICAKRGSSSCGRSMDGTTSTEEFFGTARDGEEHIIVDRFQTRGGRARRSARAFAGRTRSSSSGFGRGCVARHRGDRTSRAFRGRTRRDARDHARRRVGASVARAVWRPVRFSARAGGGSFSPSVVTYLVDHELAAGEPHASQNRDDVLDEPVVVHRLRQLQMPEVPGRVRRAHPVRLALHRSVHGPHARIAQPAALGSALLVRLRGLDLAHGHLPLHRSRSFAGKSHIEGAGVRRGPERGARAAATLANHFASLRGGAKKLAPAGHARSHRETAPRTAPPSPGAAPRWSAGTDRSPTSCVGVVENGGPSDPRKRKCGTRDQRAREEHNARLGSLQSEFVK